MDWENYIPAIIIALIAIVILGMVTNSALSDYYTHEENMAKIQKCKGIN